MGKNIFVNKRTGKEIRRNDPVDEEVVFEGGVMITETDREGIITYVNKKFQEMTGYAKEELIGVSHNLIRHPDMPKGAFRSMWKTLSEGKVWRGYVKNLRKDGRYYWVLVYAQPKYDENGDVIGYVAGRKVADPERVEEIEKIYAEHHGDEFIDADVFECQYDEYLRNRKIENGE